MFARVCLLTTPAFAGAPRVISEYPFTQSAQTGTYFHNQLDLSIKVTDERCSLVFVTLESPDTFVPGVSRGTARHVSPSEMPDDIHFSSRVHEQGRTYVHISVPVQR
jgi:hypothetical protein